MVQYQHTEVSARKSAGRERPSSSREDNSRSSQYELVLAISSIRTQVRKCAPRTASPRLAADCAAQQYPAGSVLMQGGASVRAWKTHCRAGLWRGLPGFHAPWSHAVHQLPCLRGPLLLSGPVLKVSASVTSHA